MLIISTTALLATCKKTPEIPGWSKIEFGETTVDSLSYYVAKISTEVKSTGVSEVIQHGHCWSKGKEPTITDNKTELGNTLNTGTFKDELNELKDSTTYYVRPYIAY